MSGGQIMHGASRSQRLLCNNQVTEIRGAAGEAGTIFACRKGVMPLCLLQIPESRSHLRGSGRHGAVCPLFSREDD